MSKIDVKKIERMWALKKELTERLVWGIQSLANDDCEPEYFETVCCVAEQLHVDMSAGLLKEDIEYVQSSVREMLVRIGELYNIEVTYE